MGGIVAVGGSRAAPTGGKGGNCGQGGRREEPMPPLPTLPPLPPLAQRKMIHSTPITTASSTEKPTSRRRSRGGVTAAAVGATV